MVAKDAQKIVGTIAFGTYTSMIEQALKDLQQDDVGMVEVLSLYIDPAYQNQGIGGRLFAAILEKIRAAGFQQFCLYTGYVKGRRFWTKKLGPASIVYPDYYGKGLNADIWIRGLDL